MLIEILGSWNRGVSSNLQALFTLCSCLCCSAHGATAAGGGATWRLTGREARREAEEEARRLLAGHPLGPRVLCAVPEGRKPAEGCCWGVPGRHKAGAAAVTLWVWSLRRPKAVRLVHFAVFCSGLVYFQRLNTTSSSLLCF